MSKTIRKIHEYIQKQELNQLLFFFISIRKLFYIKTIISHHYNLYL